eukprot:Seg529.4 transcript_id=Seg529.4/GoldUCD/mRNA.D3Y31 product="hypothetical protein" protein_id=Seg529.4/GoldUCD/D3Y31
MNAKSQPKDEKVSLEELEKFDLSEKFPGWNYAYYHQQFNGHFYYYVSKGHPQIEIIMISKEHAWTMYFEGKERDVDFSWCNMPKRIETISDIQNLLTNIQSLKPCPAIEFDKFASIVSVCDNGVAFRTKKKEPAAFIETQPSLFHKKVIRLATCMILLPDIDTISSVPCDCCRKAGQYLSLRSIQSNKDSNDFKQKKFCRLDQLEHEELLRLARENSKKLRVMNKRMKYLETFKKKVTSVGKKTNDDLSVLFDDLKKGIIGKQSCYKSPVCRWSSCNEELNSCEELFQHTREHIAVQADVAPCLRKYECSGFLRLPTGRTLSDYKNFNRPGGGWNEQQLAEMRKRFVEKKLEDRARWGGLFFDEVKVKEGLVFDPSTWELVGFTDLGSEEIDLEGLLSEDNSASGKKCEDG